LGAELNTQEVVEMIDAITKGRNYRLDVPTTQSSDEMYVGFDTGAVIFHGVGMSFLATITDPRTAREIAAALVSWANHKDGGLPFTPLLNSGWRYEWYKRSVANMTQETKDRNLQDLEAIYRNPNTSTEEADDIARAIVVLKDAGAKSSV
jgi:hypothetical protein